MSLAVHWPSKYVLVKSFSKMSKDRFEQFAQPPAEMRLDRLLLLEQMIQPAIQPIGLHLFRRDVQQIRQRRIKMPLDVQLAGGMAKSWDA